MLFSSGNYYRSGDGVDHGLRWCFLAIMMLSGMSGCGYQFTVEGSGPVVGGGHIEQGPPIRLALHTLKNHTFEPSLEFKYTSFLRRALSSIGSATIVEDDLSADFILHGAIISVSLPSVAFSQTRTRESRVTVKVRVTVKNRKTGKVRWKKTSTRSAEFFIGASTSTEGQSDSLQFNRVLQDRALEQAGLGIATDLADQFLSARDQGTFDLDQQQVSPATAVDPESSPSSSSTLFPLPRTSVE